MSPYAFHVLERTHVSTLHSTLADMNGPVDVLPSEDKGLIRIKYLRFHQILLSIKSKISLF